MRDCTPCLNLLILHWDFMHGIRIFCRPYSTALIIHIARQMKAGLISEVWSKRYSPSSAKSLSHWQYRSLLDFFGSFNSWTTITLQDLKCNKFVTALYELPLDTLACWDNLWIDFLELSSILAAISVTFSSVRTYCRLPLGASATEPLFSKVFNKSPNCIAMRNKNALKSVYKCLLNRVRIFSRVFFLSFFN